MNQSQQFKTSAELRELREKALQAESNLPLEQAAALQDEVETYAINTILPLTEAYEMAQKELEVWLKCSVETRSGQKLLECQQERDQLKAQLEALQNFSANKHQLELPYWIKVDGENITASMIRTLRSQVESLTKFREGIEQNAPACGACAEALFCGSVMHEHDSDCVYKKVESLTQDKDMLDWLEQDGKLFQIFHTSIPLKDWKNNTWNVRQAITSAIQKESK